MWWQLSYSVPRMTFRFLRNGIFLMACWSFPIVALAGEYQYIRIGSPKDVTTSPTAGTAMMGGAAIWMRPFAGYARRAAAATF